MQLFCHNIPTVLLISVQESACESEDELSHDWEEISPTDEQLQEYTNNFCTSTATLVSMDKESSKEPVDTAEAKYSPQLSAETVAKSLLQKFANRRHPAACELQWLVSFQDAPQCLLPLPQTVAVAPDDVPQVTRQNSLPVFCHQSCTAHTYMTSVSTFSGLGNCCVIKGSYFNLVSVVCSFILPRINLWCCHKT